MKRILYIKRDYVGRAPLRRQWRAVLMNSIFFSGTQGFFEKALHKQFKVKEVSVKKFFALEPDEINRNYDALFVNYRAGLAFDSSGKKEALIEIGERTSLPKVLFIGSDQASSMLSDAVLDRYDLVFKRECFKDRNKYSISEKNKKKLYTTMLTNPLDTSLRSPLFYPAHFFKRIDYQKKLDKEYDVFFLGVVTSKNSNRFNVWDRIVKEGFQTYGGIHVKKGENIEIPTKLGFDRISPQNFIDSVKKARINLALDGIGEFTFRHLELLCLGEFMISSPSIRELDLPIPVKEDVHYVSYNDLDEMVEKIRFYLNNDTERAKIARQGKEMFDRCYSPKNHGKYIEEKLEIIL